MIHFTDNIHIIQGLSIHHFQHSSVIYLTSERKTLRLEGELDALFRSFLKQPTVTAPFIGKADVSEKNDLTKSIQSLISLGLLMRD